MKLHVSGVKVPKLGSIQDRIIRQHLTKESEKETKKTQLLALLVVNSIPFNNQQAATAWEGKVKKIWKEYLGLELGLEIPEQDEKDEALMEYYLKTVKKLKLKLSKPTKGKAGLVVTGLENI